MTLPTIYTVSLLQKAEDDIQDFRNSGNKPVVRKIESLLKELKEHPRTGTGKPEMLTGNYSGYWSRRITLEHRLLYTIQDNIVTVFIVSAKGHYE